MLYIARESETVYTPQSKTLNDPEVLKLARLWIDRCINHHKFCPDIPSREQAQKALTTKSTSAGGTITLVRSSTHIDSDPGFYPTRLIELGSKDDPHVKLRVMKNATHRNDALDKPSRHYITLSHCWGKKGNHFSLQTSNLDDFRTRGIPLKELPKTFSDAIHLARQLSSNIKYIWIDSICIIQDDKADWLHESTLMFQVYGNSYCNLSATAASDSSQGLYMERDPQLLWGENVDLNTEDLLKTGSKRKRDSLDLGSLIQRCSIVDPTFWDRKVEAAPVNTRAWVLQERLLAPRVLHFCDGQIVWECRELSASESASAGITSLELSSGTIRDRIRFKSLVFLGNNHQVVPGIERSFTDQSHENWKRIVERYSLTSLTKPADKLIALAGIAEQMSTQVGAPYVAGMWNNVYFASQLLWRVETHYKNGKFLHPSKRPKDYRAPTFSWAAIDAPQGIRCGETKEPEHLLIEVSAVNILPDPQANSPFGLVREGSFIKLKCQRVDIEVEKKKRMTIDGEEEDMYTWTFTGDREEIHAKIHPNVYLDSPADDFDNIRGPIANMCLVPAYQNSSRDLIGLLLQKKDSKDHTNCYRRVGLSVIPHYVGSLNTFMEEVTGRRRNIKREIVVI